MSRLRTTDNTKEMAWLVLIQEPNATAHGMATPELEWCESKTLAEKVAQQALDDALMDAYPVTVYVLFCRKQGVTP